MCVSGLTIFPTGGMSGVAPSLQQPKICSSPPPGKIPQAALPSPKVTLPLNNNFYVITQ